MFRAGTFEFMFAPINEANFLASMKDAAIGTKDGAVAGTVPRSLSVVPRHYAALVAADAQLLNPLADLVRTKTICGCVTLCGFDAKRFNEMSIY
jgi:hypothetical protein